jgi:SAM-dependent methyltransferase
MTIEVPNSWAYDFFSAGFRECFSKLGKFARTEAEVVEIEEMLCLQPGGRILDVPCGFGRHSGVLFRRGYHVVGVDSSSDQLSIARVENPGPHYIKADMREVPQGPFDVVLNLWTSFGYLETRDDDLLALRRWFSVLNSQGALLMELTDLERAVFENRKENEQHSYTKKCVNGVLEEAVFDWDAQIAQVKYTHDGESRVCRTRLYSQQDIKSMLESIGFHIQSLSGNFRGDKKRPQDRLVILCRKP